jgi:hypothetical protein
MGGFRAMVEMEAYILIPSTYMGSLEKEDMVSMVLDMPLARPLAKSPFDCHDPPPTRGRQQAKIVKILHVRSPWVVDKEDDNIGTHPVVYQLAGG